MPPITPEDRKFKILVVFKDMPGSDKADAIDRFELDHIGYNFKVLGISEIKEYSRDLDES